MAWTPPEGDAVQAAASSWTPPAGDAAPSSNQDQASIGAWADSQNSPDPAISSQRLDEENSPQIAEQAKASGKPAVPLYHYQKNGQDIYSRNPSSGDSTPGGPDISPIQHTPAGTSDQLVDVGLPFKVRASDIDTQAVPNLLMGAYSKLLEQDVGSDQWMASGDRKKFLQRRAKDLQEQNAPLTQDPQTNLGRQTVPFAEQMAFPGSLSGMVLGGAVTSGLEPTTSDEQSQSGNALEGGLFSAAGYGTGKVLGTVAQPVSNMLNTEQRAALARLKTQGFQSNAAQETGSPALNSVAAANREHGVSPGSFTDQQNNWFKQKAASTAGFIAPTDLSRDAIEDQMNALGLAHKEIYDSNPISTNMFQGQIVTAPVALGLKAGGAKDDLTRGIEAAYKQASVMGVPSGPSTTTIPGVLKHIQKFTNPKTGQVDTDALASMRSALGRIQAQGTGQEQQLAGQVADMLDHHTIDQAFQNGGDASALGSINKQMQNLYSIQKATKNGDRELTPSLWLNTMKSRYSNDPAYKLAADSNTVMGNNTPNKLIQAALRHTASPAMFGATIEAMQGNYKEAAGLALLGGVVPKIGGGLINSRGGTKLLSGWANSPTASAIKQMAPKVGASFAGDLAQNQSPLLQNGNQ